LANTCCELFSSWNSLLGVGQAFGTLHLADSDLEQAMSSAWVKAYPGMAGRNRSASYPFCNAVVFQLGCAAMSVRQTFTSHGNPRAPPVPSGSCKPLQGELAWLHESASPAAFWPRSRSLARRPDAPFHPAAGY
jgi:hypothetical protein